MINFITDMLCLFISGRVMNLKIRKIRMCLASAVGGIYGVLSGITELYEPFCAVSISVIMVLVCFDIKSVLSFVKTLVLMYCTGMLLGGIMSLMQNFVYSNRHLKLFSDGMDFMLLSVMFAAIFL
ncbi:MAG: sigma-E processing peptidase SpoIIGA, partial [Clostridia bacterium]|nr:sigma-E processing peptidase SpoIIGA [Clostridia bacterium]